MSEDGKVIPVKVALRCRPLVTKEVSEGCSQCIQFIKGEQQLILGNNKAFTYDFVFSPTSPQRDVYDTSVKQLVTGIVKGIYFLLKSPSVTITPSGSRGVLFNQIGSSA